MKSTVKSVLTILGLLALIPACIIAFYAAGIGLFFYKATSQMHAGRKYMDSLNNKDFQTWVDRTKKYLAEDNPKDFIIGSKPVPPELKQIKIVRIDEGTNFVIYLWMGGMDHTYLKIEQMDNDIYKFTAIYNDNESKVIKLVGSETTHTNLESTGKVPGGN